MGILKRVDGGLDRMVVGVDGGSFVELRCLIHEIKSVGT